MSNTVHYLSSEKGLKSPDGEVVECPECGRLGAKRQSATQLDRIYMLHSVEVREIEPQRKITPLDYCVMGPGDFHEKKNERVKKKFTPKRKDKK